MAVKTFTTGEVLTAADTNTYLNNGGLVYVTSGTFASVASLSVNNCFTSTYDNYRIIVNVTATSGFPAIYLRFRKSGADFTGANYYYWGLGYGSNGAGSNYNAGGATFCYVGGASGHFTFDAKVDGTDPQITGQSIFYDGATPFVGRTIYSWLGIGNTYDGFTIYPASSTMTGNYKIYGYRKA